MTRYLLLILAAFAITTCFARDPSLVVEVFRHGARGPIDLKRDDSWGDMVGQLTPVGMRQHYLLGKALVDKYPFLKEKYDASKILIRSTDYNRTIMSAYSQLAAIYENSGLGIPEKTSELAVPGWKSPVVEQTRKDMKDSFAIPTNFQPLPLHVRGYTEKDYSLKSIDSCLKAKEWGNLNIEDKETQAMKEELSGLIKFLKDAKVDYQEIADMVSIGDTMISNRFQGHALYGDMKPDDANYKALKFIYEWLFFKKYTEGYDQRALLSVNLLNEVKDYMSNTINKKSNLKFVFLSAHDSTLVPILGLFNITNKTCLHENYKLEKEQKDKKYPYCAFPVFASNIVFEFYDKFENEEAYVIFSYNGRPIDICGANKENKCPYTDFLKYIEKATNGHTLQTFEDKCGLAVAPAKGSSVGILIGILASVAGLLFIGLIVTCVSLGVKGKQRKQAEKAISLINSDL